MPTIFAVTRTRGAAFDDSVPLESQAEWAEHAAFMNGLHAEGFVLLGGSLEGTPDVLLIVRAKSVNEIEAHFSQDPWTKNNLLRVKQIAPWTVRLGSVG